MTNEEAIKQLKKCKSFHNGSYGTAFDLAIKALEQARWIPVSERLPEYKGDYLVTFKLLFTYPVEVCYFDGQAWDKGQYDAVLAWMPLPQLYKAESEE